MSKAKILVVEDDVDISNMLRIYFSGQGYDVQVAPRGGDALEYTRKQLPHLIVLDIMLPDMDGYAVCKNLRTTTRTSHIPIIFLTQKDERSDKIAGLELGADDYITKPFDIEELKLRVQNAIQRSEMISLTDPNSGLPSGRLIEEQLRALMRDASNTWTYIDLKINNLEAFKEVYGFVAGNEAQRFAALLLGEVADDLGTANDFVGHPGGDNFIVITHAEDPAALIERITTRFEDEIKQHYSFIDRERGYVIVQDEGQERQVPLMTISSGSVSARIRTFADIREITEMAAEDRRTGGHAPIEEYETEW
ncbi:MAG: response regulator [Anaerolineae bacterium]|nr:response regulator [Anaerolineae bacterium]